MATPSTDQLLARVRKLLALTASPNVHEAAAAAARAQALITRHKLQALLDAQDDAEATLSDGRDAPLETARRVRKWKVVLAGALAHANGCEAYTVAVSRREEHLCIAGRPEDRAAVAALWDWLVKRLEWLSASHGTDAPREWHESFRIGAAETIAERLAEAQSAAKADTAKTATALVHIDAALQARAEAVSRYVDAHLRLKPGRRILVDVDALDAGRAAGHLVPLPRKNDG